VEIRKIRENPWLLIICLSEMPNEVRDKRFVCVNVCNYVFLEICSSVPERFWIFIWTNRNFM